MAARGHHEIFCARADHLMASGPEDEKWCTRKMSGAKTGKFGQQDKVRTIGMAMTFDRDIFWWPAIQRHKFSQKWLPCVTIGTYFSARYVPPVCSGGNIWRYPSGKNTKMSGNVLKNWGNQFFFLSEAVTSPGICAPTLSWLRQNFSRHR
jgi:hypothetical protein